MRTPQIKVPLVFGNSHFYPASRGLQLEGSGVVGAFLFFFFGGGGGGWGCWFRV